MDSPLLTIGSFCTGVGWLDIAARLALQYHGIRTRPAFACEWDSYAATVLRSRMEESALEPCPIWCGDLRSFPAASFRGVVDAVAAGFPCQDISCAGRGDGIYGARSGMFFDILAAVRDMGCGLLFLENVGAITVRGLDAVLGSLAEIGFAAEWTCLTASAVGAPHKRERWFCVAVANGGRERRQQVAGSPFSDEATHEGRAEGNDHQPAGHVAAMDDSAVARRKKNDPEARPADA